MDRVGHFRMFQSTHQSIATYISMGQRGNFVDVPTDCPQRDERLGWTGDAQAFSVQHIILMCRIFGKWLQDVSTRPGAGWNGAMLSSNVLGPKAGASTGWADVSNIIPWNMFMIYGDTAFLQGNIPA